MCAQNATTAEAYGSMVSHGSAVLQLYIRLLLLFISICLSHERTWGMLFKLRYTNVRIIIIIIIIRH